MSFEAYKLAVAITLTENVTRGLTAMSGHFARTNADASKLQGTLERIGKMALGGGLLVSGGLVVATGLKGLVDAAAAIETAQTKFKTLNLSSSDNSLAFTTAATNAQKVLGTSIKDNIGVVHDLHTVFGDLHHAVNFSEEFTKFTVLAKYMGGEHAAEGMAMAGAKALEHRPGLVADPARMKEELNMMEQVYVGTRGKVNPKEFFQMAQTGKMAYALYDKEYLYGHMAAYAQGKTGTTAATAGMTAFSSLIGGHMDGKAKGLLSELGLYQEGFSKARQKLINDSLNKLPADQRASALASLGGQTALSGGLKDELSQKFARRPDLFIKDDLIPALKNHFGEGLTDEQLAKLVGTHFNRNTADFIGEEILFGKKFDKDSHIFRTSDNASGANEKFSQTYAGSVIKLSAAWENFKGVLGMDGGVIDMATKGLTLLGGALRGMTEFTREHPLLTKMIVGGLVALSGLAILGGGLLLIGAAFSALGTVITFVSGGAVLGMFGSAIGSIALPIARLSTLAIPSLIAGLATLTAKMPMFFAALGQFIPQAVAGAIALSAGYAIGEQLNKLLSKDTKDSIGDAGLRVLSFLNIGDARKLVNQGSGGQLYKNQGYESAGVNLTPDARTRLAALDSGKFNGYAQPQSRDKPIQVTTNVNMDGRKVAESVSTHQANAANKPSNSAPQFDATMGFPQMALSR